MENFAVRGQWGKDGTLGNPTFRRQAEEETTEETRKEVEESTGQGPSEVGERFEKEGHILLLGAEWGLAGKEL